MLVRKQSLNFLIFYRSLDQSYATTLTCLVQVLCQIRTCHHHHIYDLTKCLVSRVHVLFQLRTFRHHIYDLTKCLADVSYRLSSSYSYYSFLPYIVINHCLPLLLFIMVYKRQKPRFREAYMTQQKVAGKHDLLKHDVKKWSHSIPESILSLDFTEFQQLIKLPQHPGTLIHQPLTDAQMHFYHNYVHPVDRSWIHLNKARQCGWTETVLRILAYHSIHKYAGKKIGIVAGTNMNTTKQIFGRLIELYKEVPELIAEKGALRLFLPNGTEIYGGAANVETFTGWTKFGAFFMDEAAKWDLKEDRPVLNAMLPIARSNRSDVFMISTPKGPRGFFYHIAMGQTARFQRCQYDIYDGGYQLYSYDEIEEMINSSEEDPAQEYMCQFVIGRDSIWGSLEPEDYTNEYAEAQYYI